MTDGNDDSPMRSSDHHGHRRRYLHHDMPLDPDARLKALERLVTEKALAAKNTRASSDKLESLMRSNLSDKDALSS